MIVRFPLERRIDHGRVVPIHGALAEIIILPVVRIERDPPSSRFAIAPDHPLWGNE